MRCPVSWGRIRTCRSRTMPIGAVRDRRPTSPHTLARAARSSRHLSTSIECVPLMRGAGSRPRSTARAPSAVVIVTRRSHAGTSPERRHRSARVRTAAARQVVES